jgi:hypothetical protein
VSIGGRNARHNELGATGDFRSFRFCNDRGSICCKLQLWSVILILSLARLVDLGGGIIAKCVISAIPPGLNFDQKRFRFLGRAL